MKLDLKKTYIKWGVMATIVIWSSLLFYFLLFHGEQLKVVMTNIINVAMPIIWGLIMGYLFTPLLNYFEKMQNKLCVKFDIKDSKKKNKCIRGISIIITWFIIFMILYILISMLIKQIIPSIQIIINDFDIYIINATNWLTALLDDNENLRTLSIDLINRYSDILSDWVNNTLLPKSSELIRVFSVGILNVFVVLWDLIIGFIISIYVMSNKEVFVGQGKKIIYAFFKVGTANSIINFGRFTHKTFSGFIIGKVIDSIIIGLLCFIGTTLIQTPFPSLISVIIGITNFIPFFGPWIGGIPCAILVLLVDISNPLKFVYFIIFVLFLQQLDGNVIGPKILGESTGLPGFWVIVSIILFGGFFGVPGMIVGVPTMAVIYGVISGMVNKNLKMKGLAYGHKDFIQVQSITEDQTIVYKENESIDSKNNQQEVKKSNKEHNKKDKK